MIFVLRLLKGCVLFCATGGFPERFINLCTLKGITLWNVKNDGEKVEAFTLNSDYKKIRQPAKKSGMKVKIKKKIGLPIFLHRNKSRVGVCLGLLLAVLILIYSSLCIWNVEITGIETVNKDAFTKILENCNVKIGSLKSKIDTEYTEKQIMENVKNISWVSVNIYGSKVSVEIREVQKSPEIVDYTEPENIVAKKSGTITLVKGFTGTNSVKDGDNVLKGDVLISGVVTNGDNSETLIKATGEVYARTTTDLKCESVSKTTFEIIEDSRNCHSIQFFGIKLPMLFKKRGSEVIGEYEEAVLKGEEKLPVITKFQSYSVVNTRNVTLNNEECKLLSLSDCVKKKRVTCDGMDVSSVKYKIKKSTEKTTVICEIKGVENIAVSSPIYVE